MEETINCIFCCKDRKPSREHVVPEFAGGGLVIKDVCKVCNEKMGSDFEGPLSHSVLFRLARYLYKIEGKSSSPINPFPGTGTAMDGSKVRLDEDGVPYLVPQVEETDLGEKTVKLSLKLDISDRCRLPKILEAKIRRVAKKKWPHMGANEVDDLVAKTVESIPSEFEINSSRPSIRFHEHVDFNHLILLMMKICFEITFHHHGRAVVADSAFTTLKDAINTRNVDVGTNGKLFPNPDPFSLLAQKEGVHHIVLSSSGCYVRLFNLSAIIPVVGSNSRFALNTEEWILYELDYINETYEKHNFLSYIAVK